MKAKGPEAMTRILLAGMMLAAGYVGYFGYKTGGMDAPGALDELLSGHGPAPDQYRVGVVWVAHWMTLLPHVSVPFALAAIDLVSGLVAGLLLVEVLRRSSVYAQAEATGRWLGCAALVVGVGWSMSWLMWLKRPETMAAGMLVVVMVWLLQEPGSENPDPGHPDSGRSERGGGTSLLLVGLSLALATVRADVAVALNIGMLIVALRGGRFARTRGLAAATAVAGALIAGGLQLWLMRVVYPQADYGRVKMWQLVPNLIHASRWPPFLLFLLPLGWMAVQVWRRRFAGDAVGLAVLVGAGIYMGLWVTMGKVDEVRIFLPLALGLAPLTAQMVMLRARESQVADV